MGRVTRSTAALDNSKATPLGSSGQQQDTHVPVESKRGGRVKAHNSRLLPWGDVCRAPLPPAYLGLMCERQAPHSQIEALRQRHSYSQKMFPGECR